MEFIYFNIALHGRHYLRTGEYLAMDLPRDVEAVLASKFPASEGYSITRSARPNTSTSTPVAN